MYPILLDENDGIILIKVVRNNSTDRTNFFQKLVKYLLYIAFLF